MTDQTPEQKARDLIDKKLVEAGLAVQLKDGIDKPCGDRAEAVLNGLGEASAA